MYKDPIKLSLVGICMTTVLSILLISISKPSCAMDVDSEKDVKINWGKALSLSMMIGIVVGIMIFLLTMDKVSEPVIEQPAIMEFSKKISNAY